MHNKQLAIIGHGRFGQLLAELLLTYTDHAITVVSSKPLSSEHDRLRFSSFSELEKIVGEADVIIPCVPISKFEKMMSTIAPFVKKSALVMDVCSVKVAPIDMMKKHLPKTVQILGTHPLFGRDAIAMNKGLKNLKIVLVATRIEPKLFSEWKKIWKKMKLEILEMTAEEHDAHAAYSHAYSFLVGKIGMLMGIKPTPIDTKGFQKLFQLQEVVAHDSDQLFVDMQRYNPFAKKMRVEFEDALKKIEEQLESIS